MSKAKKQRSVLAWHFLEAPILPHGDGRAVVVGETLTVEPPIVACKRGLHASRRAIDALQYAPGGLVCRVRCSGEIVERGDKLACSERTVLWMADATRVLRLFACDIAEDALLAERKRGREPHVDSWKAIEVARRWVDGKATDVERSAARSAAWSAARSAAWSAARSAAESAAESAAGSAAWSAAESAAESAAGSAAWSAAESAAWSAARSAAWSAAESAAWSAANRKLEQALRRLGRSGRTKVKP